MRSAATPSVSPRYKWIALSNTTLGMLMATLNTSIVMISLPAIFAGIGLNPLQSGNVSYLLWMMMGYTLAMAVLVVTFGRLGDMFGRVRIYNLGFVVFTAGSIGLACDPLTNSPGAAWLIAWRFVQGIGGAMLFANSTAILTDAFPPHRRGMAMGINQVASIAGSFIGLVAGGLLATVHWRMVFVVSVPVGVFGTIWSYISLRELGEHKRSRMDLWGNLLLAAGLMVLLTGITYGIQPYGGQSTGWLNPLVLTAIGGGLLVLGVFIAVELHTEHPMLNMRLFQIRAFTFGNLAALLSSIGRGGLQFMLVIWLQGIWLPLHGYDYAQTPLWAGIYMLPITAGFVVAGPICGMLSDRFGARGFASVGLLIVAATFIGLLLIPVNFSYWEFAVMTGLSGIGSGMFGAPNRTAIMNAVPASDRGAASGVTSTLQNAGTSLSMALFFSLMIVGLSHSLPQALQSGLAAQGVPATQALAISALPPVASLFAAFLGYNPVQTMLQQAGVLNTLAPSDVATLTGHTFFPQLISSPFQSGLVVVFLVAAAMSVIGAAMSLSRGKMIVVDDMPPTEGDKPGTAS
ncbi:MAG: MFS transporter [Propionibacteriaceae bacterium]|nr:MFS transporter [Propionibacteriaceae bacterium]